MNGRMGQPKHRYVSRLKESAEASDWLPLISACIAAIACNEPSVFIRFSYVFRYPEDFPKGRIIKKEGMDNIRKINAVKLLDYLYNLGYTEHSSKSIIMQRKMAEGEVTRICNRLDGDWMFY